MWHFGHIVNIERMRFRRAACFVSVDKVAVAIYDHFGHSDRLCHILNGELRGTYALHMNMYL